MVSRACARILLAAVSTLCACPCIGIVENGCMSLERQRVDGTEIKHAQDTAICPVCIRHGTTCCARATLESRMRRRRAGSALRTKGLLR